MENYILSHVLPPIILVVLLSIGFLIILLGLPGLFVITAGALIYALMTGFAEISLITILALLAIAVAAEIIDFLFGIFFAKRFEVSKNGIFGGIAGAIAGAAIGFPIPLVGSLAGMFAGAFLGACLFEYQKSKDRRLALKAGVGVLLGRIGAILIKVVIAVVMMVIIFRKIL